MSNKRGETKTKSNRNPNTSKASTKLPLMRSYARIKPASADKKGGTNAKQSISEWDGASGTVTFHPSVEGVKNKSVRFEHFLHCIAPTDSQEHTYLTMCSPLVSLWLDGYDCDVICYGQTGSGKTYTQFGPPHSMQEALSNLGESGGKGTLSSQSIMEEHHGFILRTGFAALETVQRINAKNDGSLALLHGSMVEMSILQKSQNAGDLLNHKKSCFVDKDKHLEGAVHRPLLDARDLIELAAAVETRLSRGTKMNNSSSRSHCITVFTLHVRDPNNCVRVSRFNFFDFMGSERFSGANSAHNSGQSARSTTAGWEGIFANYSLLFLGEAVRAAANARRKKKGTIQKMGGQGFLNELLAGSLVGSAVTAMVTCLSPSPRNGAESFLSCKYSKDMARMQNDPKPQPNVPYQDMVAAAQKGLAKSQAIVKKGVAGKYQKKRMAEVTGFETTLRILKQLGGGGAEGANGGGSKK